MEIDFLRGLELKLSIKLLAGLVSPESSVLGLQMANFSISLPWPFLYTLIPCSLSLLIRTSIILNLGLFKSLILT
jgi:hypothetical protein